MKIQAISEPLINNSPMDTVQGLEGVNQCILQQLGPIKVPLLQEIAMHLIGAGGKRLRPLLTLWVASSLSYKDNTHIPLATAIEFIHTATLLHDDVVDGAVDRRGQPSANVVWGNQATILTGDFLFTRSFELIVSQGNMDVLQEVSKAASEIAEGEMLQLVHGQDLEMTRDIYFRIITAKTAALFRAACAIGALIATTDQGHITAFRTFGEKLGIAFQLRDDMHDYESKVPGEDFHTGKITLPLLLLQEHLKDHRSPAEEKAFQQAFAERNYEFILGQLHQYSIMPAIGKMVTGYINDAIRALEDVTGPHVCQNDLEKLKELARGCV